MMKILVQKKTGDICGFVSEDESFDTLFFKTLDIDPELNQALIDRIVQSRGNSYLLADAADIETQYRSPKQRFFTFKGGILEEVVNAVFFEKKKKIIELETYDKSPSVNSFLIGKGETSLSAWLGSDLRLKLKYRLETEQAAGVAATTLNIKDLTLSLPVANALSFLNNLESYAIKCYDHTARHRKNIEELQEVTDIKSYDFTTGYPEKVKIEIPD